MSTFTAREFNRDVSAAKRAAVDGPVIITDRGEPAFVLMSIENYRDLNLRGIDVVERLRIDDEIDVEFEPIQLGLRIPGL